MILYKIEMKLFQNFYNIFSYFVKKDIHQSVESSQTITRKIGIECMTS